MKFICYKFLFNNMVLKKKFNNIFMYHIFMCGDMFVKLIKILKLIKCMLILLFDITFNSLNFVSISLSLVIFEKVT